MQALHVKSGSKRCLEDKVSEKMGKRRKKSGNSRELKERLKNGREGKRMYLSGGNGRMGGEPYSGLSPLVHCFFWKSWKCSPKLHHINYQKAPLVPLHLFWFFIFKLSQRSAHLLASFFYGHLFANLRSLCWLHSTTQITLSRPLCRPLWFSSFLSLQQ